MQLSNLKDHYRDHDTSDNRKEKKKNMSDYKFETLQLHVGQEEPDPASDARAVPIYQTTSYVFKNSAHAAARFGLADAGNIYGRLTNSTQDVFEKRIAALEGGVAALATASGAAAITYTIEALAADGGHIVAQKTIYGGSFNLLEHTLTHYGITTTFVDAHNLKEVEDAIADGSLHVFDTSTFTVDGKELTTYKKDGSDTEYISDGYFHESEYGYAPAFDIAIDGITSITE